MQKVEETVVGNRNFLVAIVADLEQQFGYKGYKEMEGLPMIQRKEGRADVVNYLKRKYDVR